MNIIIFSVAAMVLMVPRFLIRKQTALYRAIAREEILSAAPLLSPSKRPSSRMLFFFELLLCGLAFVFLPFESFIVLFIIYAAVYLLAPILPPTNGAAFIVEALVDHIQTKAAYARATINQVGDMRIQTLPDERREELRAHTTDEWHKLSPESVPFDQEEYIKFRIVELTAPDQFNQHLVPQYRILSDSLKVLASLESKVAG